MATEAFSMTSGSFVLRFDEQQSSSTWQSDLNGLCRISVHRKILRMEFFHLHHPPDVTVLCDRKGCEQVADYLEVDDHGHEYLVCLRTPTARRMLRVWRRGNQVLIFLSEADLPLEPWQQPHCTWRADYVGKSTQTKAPRTRLKSRDAS